MSYCLRFICLEAKYIIYYIIIYTYSMCVYIYIYIALQQAATSRPSPRHTAELRRSLSPNALWSIPEDSVHEMDFGVAYRLDYNFRFRILII